MEAATVLVVDDHVGVGQALEDALTIMGYDVVWVRSAEEGWAVFSRCCPRAVVTDNTMPNMTGLELSRRIREAAPETPIIMLSATPPPAAYRVCDCVLAKPVRVADLVLALERLGVFPLSI